MSYPYTVPPFAPGDETPDRLEPLRPRLARPAAPASPVPAPAAAESSRGAVTRWVEFVLRVPLVWKIAGAHALILVAALVAVLAGRGHAVSHATDFLWIALGVSFVVDLGLVLVALRPLRQLELVAARIWRGDLAARVAPSPTADRDVARIGQTLNLLLDGLTGDRERMRVLASQVVRAQDEERSRIARELHDSVAQTLAAAKLQIHAITEAITEAIARDPATAGECRDRLGMLRELVAGAMEEVRTMSHTIHPRVLDDLGLVAALEWLARQTRGASGTNQVQVRVETDLTVGEIPKTVASVLYRVAQEGLRNAIVHAWPRSVLLRVEADERRATLEVVDDGVGFDVAEAEARRPGMGLFAMRERVALVHGTVEIYSVPGRGTRVSATIPLDAMGD